MFVKTCGNCFHAVKPQEGYYSDCEVRYCLKICDFVKASEVAENECDAWEWDCVGESPEELRQEAIERVHELSKGDWWESNG